METHQKSMHQIKDEVIALQDDFIQFGEKYLPISIDTDATRATKSAS